MFSPPAPPFLDGAVCSGSLPLTIEWSGGDKSTLEDVSSWVSRHRAALSSLLQQHGALLFRGFPLPSAPAFGAFVSAFGGRDLPYEDSLSFAVRLPVCERVCTTNEGKTGGMVFHHEQAASPRYPSQLFFYCLSPASVSGGGTGVSPSWALLEALERAHPSFVSDCEARGLRYTSVLPPAPDASRGAGRSWRSFFGVEDAPAAEARMAELGYAWRWGPGDVLTMTTPVLSAVRAVPGPRGPATRVFFNQAVAQAFANALEFERVVGAGSDGGAGGAAAPPPSLTFGDGSPVPMAPLEFARAACDAAAVDIQWRAGDVALLDNFLVLHARRAYEGERKVYASLVA